MPASKCKVSNQHHSIPCNLKHPIPTSQACIRYSSHFFRNDYLMACSEWLTVESVETRLLWMRPRPTNVAMAALGPGRNRSSSEKPRQKFGDLVPVRTLLHTQFWRRLSFRSCFLPVMRQDFCVLSPSEFVNCHVTQGNIVEPLRQKSLFKGN
jgi:hypothetical protein